MDVIKYRKLYLSENWGNNRFRMLKYGVEFKEIYIRKNNRITYLDFGRNHPMVLSGKAYWLNDRELCIGYELDSNHEIYRPIFSYKRQRLLDKIHLNIINPYKFWNKIKSKYFISLAKMYSKRIPIECVEHIVMFIIFEC
mgnify:FL=1|jgi:hypothetical protein